MSNVATEPLKIAMVAPPWFEVPPLGYGGIEAVVGDLTDQLVRRGHHVTLVGAGAHKTKAQRFIPIFEECPTNLGKPGEIITMAAYTAGVAAALEELDLDIVHEHSATGPLLARSRTIPTVFTAHGPVDAEHARLFKNLGQTVSVVAISDSQRNLNSNVNWVGRVHNGLDVESFPFRTLKSDYVLWLGRYSLQKAPHLAVLAARKAGKRIILAGKRSEPAEIAYFEQYVKPLLGPDVTDFGPADAAQKRKLLAGAQALLMPIQWDEPFGMVMIEAMVCGTPVLAFRRGAAPEIVGNGDGGWLVDDVDDMAAALVDADFEALALLKLRQRVVQHFSTAAMARGYEDIYLKLVAENRLATEVAYIGATDWRGLDGLV